MYKKVYIKEKQRKQMQHGKEQVDFYKISQDRLL